MSAAGRRPNQARGEFSRPFAWDEALAFGLGVLRLSSRDFWALTPRELAAAANAHLGHSGRHAPAPSFAEFVELAAAHPD